MQHDLIERYIYAVKRGLPQKIKADVEQELRSHISDMLSDRTGDVLPTDTDVRVVLTELGPPKELAEKYSPDKQKALISGTYFTTYKFVLKIVALCVVFGLLVSNIIEIIFGAVWYEEILDFFASIILSLLTSFSIVTLIFAVFERRGIKIETGLGLDDLPTVPKKNEEIKIGETITGIAFSVVFCIVFIAFPGIMGGFFDGVFIPLLNIEVARSMWYLTLAMTVIGIAKAVYGMHEGRYTPALCVFSVIADVISFALTFVFFSNGALINQEFIGFLAKIIEGDAAIVTTIFENFGMFMIVIISFALVIDITEMIVKGVRASRA